MNNVYGLISTIKTWLCRRMGRGVGRVRLDYTTWQHASVYFISCKSRRTHCVSNGYMMTSICTLRHGTADRPISSFQWHTWLTTTVEHDRWLAMLCAQRSQRQHQCNLEYSVAAESQHYINDPLTYVP